jgi:NtrC-family two-component system response regulator AlgB
MRVLIVDDELNIRRTTSIALQAMGHETELAENGAQAMTRLKEHRIDAAFLDLRLGHEDGIDVLRRIQAEYPDVAVIVFTAYSTVESAVGAMRHGAYDYITKPFLPEEISQMLSRLEDERRMRNKVSELESEIRELQPEIRLESSDPRMSDVYELCFRAAPSDANILIQGKSGTGKTVIAKAIHERSSRAREAFVTVHCPSLSKELLESELFGHAKGAFTGAVQETWGKVAKADGGTLFLDEIGEMPMELQPKLLRLLQDREYERVGETTVHRADIRVIAATNRDLEACVREGTFREDLLYRLNVIAVTMPSLAERPGDILPLARGYLQFFAGRMGRRDLRYSPEVEKAFKEARWSGNLREMRNIVERAVILARGAEIRIADLPRDFGDPEGANGLPAPQVGAMISLEDLESAHIRRVLKVAESLEEAARILGIDTATLYRKRKKMGLLK